MIAKIVVSMLMMCGALFSSSVQYITSNEIITPRLKIGAIIRQEPGFETDFLVLHCLLKKYNPKTLFEIGTCQGYGTLIIANACPGCSIISLDLPPNSPPYFINAADIGRKCNLPFKQVYGDSMTYNYSQHGPIEAWFIDGAHEYKFVKYETEQAIHSNPKLLIFHDTDVPEVFQAVLDALEGEEYTIYRVSDTRMTYAIHD